MWRPCVPDHHSCFFFFISNYINWFIYVSYTESATMALRIRHSYQTTTHYTDNTGFPYIKVKLKNFSLFLHDFKLTSDIWHLPELWRIILITLIVKLSCKGIFNTTICIHIVTVSDKCSKATEYVALHYCFKQIFKVIFIQDNYFNLNCIQVF